MSPTCLVKNSNLENDEFMLENKGNKIGYWHFISDNVRKPHDSYPSSPPKPKIE